MRNRTPFLAADDACPLCGWWRCRCTEQAAPCAVPGTDSDPDMDEALRRVRAGGRR
jgi:hypothetical protein